MWSKAKVGLVLGAMATVLSVGSAYAATPSVVTNSDQSAKQDNLNKIKLGVFKTHNGQGNVKYVKGASLTENEQLLSLLKLDAEELKAQLKDGKSLAQIAEAQGVAEDDVISLLTKQHEEQLAKAVEDGKLTQEQADKMKEKTAEMVKNMVENTHQRMGGGFGVKFDIRDNQELLSLLKLDAEGLQTQLKNGKSLAQIAEAQGVAEDDVISLLTKQHEEQLAKAVEDGKLTQEQADKMKEKTAEMVKNMVENTHQRMGGGFGVKFDIRDNQELLSLLKLDAEGLQTQLKNGKSLAQIAEAQGVAEDDVISLLTKQHEEQLAKAVEDGKLTQEQADKMKEKTAEMVKNMVENTHQRMGGKALVKFDAKDNQELLSLLKLDAEGLKAQLKDGKSLAQIAEAQGVAEDDVISLLTKQHEEQLAKAVEDGKLTQEQADKMKEKTAEMVKNMVENTHQRMGGKALVKFDAKDNQELLSLLKLDAEGLKAQLKDGKSLAQIAEAQGVAEDEVISLLTKQHEEQLAKAVEEGKLTQEQADKVKEKTAEMVKNMVEKHKGDRPEKVIMKQQAAGE
ncbi:hypothetical protein ACI7RC_06495 [Brevibacillus sp. B_LB10_24]|uniref:hypothetical protein n=1 Tax=Brevibacillus sp. B_LB10_24 TaxID=3380645 RepID=UPI0038BD57FE